MDGKQVTPQYYIPRYPFIHLGGERHCEPEECLAQEHNTKYSRRQRSATVTFFNAIPA